MSPGARSLSLLAVIVTLGASPGRAVAQGQGRIDVDVERVALGEVLRRVASQVGVSLVVDPAVEETVTVSLREIPWRDCVDVLARMTRCQVVERPSGVLLVTQPSVLSATFEQVEVSTVLRLLAAQGGEGVWVDPRVTARVSLSFEETTWPDAVKRVAEAAGLQVAWVEGCALVGATPPDAGLARRASLAERFPGSRRVSLDQADPTLGSLLQALAVAADVSVIFDDDAIDGTSIDAVLRDVPWAEAMDLLLELVDCTAEPSSAVLHVRRRARVTLEDQTPVPVRTSLQRIASSGGASLVLSPGVAGSVAPSCRGLPADLALALVARSAGLHPWTDGEVVVVSHMPLATPPAARPHDARERVASVRAVSAPARGWFELLALIGGLRVELGPDVGTVVTADLNGVGSRRAVELTAWAGGHQVEERDGVLHVTGDGWIGAEEVASAPPAPPARPEVDVAAEEERRQDLTDQVEALMKKVVMLGERRDVEALVVTFTELRQLMSGGAVALQVVRERFAAWESRLRDLGEVRLSILLQLRLAEGDQLLRDMALALEEERFGDVAAGFERLEQEAEEMRKEAREVFVRNAEALHLRGQALRDQARRLERASRLELRLTAIAPGVGAVINGALRREGDPVLAPDGSELPELYLLKIEASGVRLRVGDTEFVRTMSP